MAGYTGEETIEEYESRQRKEKTMAKKNGKEKKIDNTSFLDGVKPRETGKPIGKELIVLTGDLPVGITKEELRKSFEEDLQDTMDGVIPYLPQIKILPGGVNLFEMPPDESGETKTVSEIVGVIGDHHKCNAFWEKPFSETGGGVSPDCSSLDGVQGFGSPGGLCMGCHKNEFGSGKDGKGKACKNMKRIHIFLDDEAIPYRLTLSATSIKVADRFFTTLSGLAKKGVSMRTNEIKTTLEKTQNADGIPYSRIKFALAEPIEIERYWQIKEFINTYRSQIRGQEIIKPESTEPNGSTDFNPGELEK